MRTAKRRIAAMLCLTAAAAAAQPRTVLERQFRKYLGRSPQAEIRAVQLKRARELLVKTDMGLRHIARLAGFENPEYLSVVFKGENGQTPGEYRRKALAADFSHSV